MTIICLMGPTATGKTELSFVLAEKFNAEIISVDSAMVYRSMNIGTAKPTLIERQQVAHHLVDICDPLEPYSAARFQTDVNSKIQEIVARGKTPLLVGGTMLYFKALQEGLSPLPRSDHQLRNTLNEQAAEIGWQQMHAKLSEVDPQSAKRIAAHDQQRIQRALEIYELTGIPMSSLWNSKHKQEGWHFVNLALIPQDRKQLHEKITKRLDLMLQQGFINEVQQLYQRGDLTTDLPAIRCVGYRQVWEYLAGHLNQKQMRDQALAATRQLAKRQLTWLRHWPKIIPFNCQSPHLKEEVISFLDTYLYS